MNAVGKLGELIVKYQYPIEVALLSILAIIIVCLLVRAIIKNKKEKDVLAEINSKVSDINDAVNSMNNKQSTAESVEQPNSSNNISVTGESPSVKVSYTVKEDKQDCTTTVHIDHEVVQGASETKAEEKAPREDLEKSTTVKESSSETVPESSENEEKEKDLEKPKVDNPEVVDTENCNLETLIKQMADDKAQELEDDREASDITIALNVPLKVYRTRDCAVDKFGKVYTEKELSEQIK